MTAALAEGPPPVGYQQRNLHFSSPAGTVLGQQVRW